MGVILNKIDGKTVCGKVVTSFGRFLGADEYIVVNDTIMNDEDINWQPTFTPVIDSSQIQNGINYLGNINAESVGLATDASISVNNSQQASLASQVQALSDQVQRLADTDYSKMLEGVIINVDASTNVDGTPLRRMSSAYTIQQINDTQNGLIMAAGGRV